MPKADPAEPKLSVDAFQQRCLELAKQFGDVLGLARGEIAFVPEMSGTEAVMTLAGRASETINRNRGKAHRVVPICAVTDNVLAWTGYRETWQKRGAEQSFRFMDGGFTLHIGRQGEVAKPQILRSEWIGRRNGAFGNDAGHPHWQLDVLETARLNTYQPPARFDDPTMPREAVEFGGVDKPVNGEDLLLGLTIERMHLASAALWWRQPSVPLAHPVETARELDRWILGCIAYLRQEFGRCAIVPGAG